MGLSVEMPAPNVMRVFINDQRAGTAVILFSYSTPVAINLPRLGEFVIDKSPTRTTSKHISQWTRSTAPIKVPEKVLAAMVESIGFDVQGLAQALAQHMKHLPEEVQVNLDALLEEH